MSTSVAAGSSSAGKKVLVIGGGIVGAITGLQFLREGYDVTLLDKGLADARCSFGNAGSLSPGSVAPLGMPGVLAKVPSMLLAENAPLKVRPRYALAALPWLTRFVLASTPSRVEEISFALRDLLSDSIDLYTDLLRELGAMDLMQRRGQLQLYPDEAYRASDASVWQLRRDRGVKVEDVNADEIRQLEPAVGSRYQCGVYLPNEGLVTNPARLVEVVTAAFRHRGGQILIGAANGLEDCGNGAAAVTGPYGRLEADIIVVAAGAWSNQLSKQAGDDLPLETQRGYHVTLPTAGVTISRPVVAADRKYFVSPMEGGIRVAGTVEFDSIDAPPDARRVEALTQSVPELLPGIDVSKGSTWMGHRPCMPDSLPVLDRSSRYWNVFYAFGNGHLGVTGAPKMAALVVALATGQTPPVDVRPYGADRFKWAGGQRKAS